MSTLLNTSEERHALVIGLCEVLCPLPPKCPCKRLPPLSLRGVAEAISKEYHYYLAGRALGVIAWLIIAKIIQEVFF
jgi:hypothetical protein